MIDLAVRIACGYSAIIVVASTVNKPKYIQINRQSISWNVNMEETYMRHCMKFLCEM